MAQRRMFSPDIVASDAFLEMPTSSRELYFQLGMYADDDGFVSPKKIMRLIGAQEDDLKVLLAKRFLLPFDTGVVVIKHWLIHNLIRADRYKETRYLEEKATLKVKENKAYTETTTKRQPLGNQMAPQVRLGKVRLGKVRLEIPQDTALRAGDQTGEFIFLFKEINPTIGILYGRPPQRQATERLLKIHPLKWWESFMVKYTQQISKDKFCPRATTPIQMETKLGAIMIYAKSLKENSKMITV